MNSSIKCGGWGLRRTTQFMSYGDLSTFISPLLALFKAQADTWIEPPTFRKQAG
jgi:hypothetical protein